MKKDEQAAQNLIFCMDDFNTVPFDESAPSFPRVSLVLLISNDILKKLVLFIELFLKARKANYKRLNLVTTPINVKKRFSNSVEIERNVLSMVID